MLVQRSVLILAFVLTGALSATAQSPEPRQNEHSATSPSIPDPQLTAPAQSPIDATEQSGAPEAKPELSRELANPTQMDAAGKAEPSKDAGEQIDNKDAEHKATAPEASPEAAPSITGVKEPETDKRASEATENIKSDAPAHAGQSANQTDATTAKPDTLHQSDAVSVSPAAPDTAVESKATSDNPATVHESGDEKGTAQPAALQTQEAPNSTTQPSHPELAVVTGGGAFAQAYKQVVLEPFAAETGITISDASENGKSGDLLLLDGAELARRCSSGDLITLELPAISPTATGATAQDDYLDGALKPCGIAALAWSNLFVYDPAKFEKRSPRTVADVFDTRRFPGKRALPRDGRGLVEALLISDGVSAGDVYGVLETSDGANRVLKKLKSLGADVIWYEHLSEAIDLVREGKAAFAFTSNGHAFTEQARGGPLGFIWDGQILHPSFFAIPKSTSEEASAKELLAFASRPEQLASLVRQIPYGPMRRSAIAGAVGMRHAVTGQGIERFLPTAPDNLRTAVRFDPVWWDANADRIETVMRIARQGPPLPARP